MNKFVRKLGRKVGYDIRPIKRDTQAGKRKIHFLHIGKAAGTQIASISEQLNAQSQTTFIVKEKHYVNLNDIPKKADYFFSIRNPISRFRSGFYSRKRKGQPRYYNEWSEHDAIAFSTFEHANDLAESLFEPGEMGVAAWAAMKSIKHTARNQSDWFYLCGNFLHVRPPVWIIRQENFDADFSRFLTVAGFDSAIPDTGFATSQVTSHRNDYTDVPELSKKAQENLRTWFAQDFVFYDMCNAWIEKGGKV